MRRARHIHETVAAWAPELRGFAAKGAEFTVDLMAQKITVGQKDYPFEIEAFRRRCLLEGLDDIDLILQSETAIAQHEQKLRAQRPWLA